MEHERRFANTEHVSILRKGVREWNKWRSDNPLIRPHITSLNHPFHSRFELKDLRGIDLSNSDLAGGYFDEVDFQEANFEGADLTVVHFSNCNLSMANFSRVFMGSFFEPTSFEIKIGNSFKQVDLSKANLEGIVLDTAIFEDVNLQNANFIRAQIFETEFIRTDFSQSKFGRTLFVNTDLSSALNLGNAIHNGPSSIGIDTIYRSKGQIAASFLRGCGLPDDFIEYVNSLTVDAIQYPYCFISYSSQDKQFAEQLFDDLQKNGVRCWFASENMKISQRIRPTIDQAIRLTDRLLIILSKNSISSKWVEKEVETAFDEERSRQETILFPIRIDNAVMETHEAWAADIRRTRHIGDFTGWENTKTYNVALDRLLRDLKSE